MDLGQCAVHDRRPFAPGYDSMPLEAFAPMLRNAMRKPRRSLYQGIPGVPGPRISCTPLGGHANS